MHRRTFVQALGASLASAVPNFRGKYSAFGQSSWNGTSGPLTSLPVSPTGRLTRIGLELYSVRDAMHRDPERTLAAVRAMGYSDVELLWSFGNFGRTTEQVRAALDREGLRAPSAHISPIILFIGWDRSLEIAHRLGHEYLIVPSFTSKDVVPDRSRDTELGTGTLDFRRLLAAVPDIDHKPCYVEQEGAADSLASARRNCEFLSKLEF